MIPTSVVGSVPAVIRSSVAHTLLAVPPLFDVALQVFGGVLVLLVVTSVVVVGPARLWATRRELRRRVRENGRYFQLLVVVLLVNKAARDVGPELSWAIGWNLTGAVYRLEGDVVALVQSVATPWLTALLSAVYLVGYVFLLVFPFVAYLALDDQRPLKVTAVAYACNYALGLCCYVLFVVYGPRNLLPGQVESLLYVAYPQTQLLTSEVNVNTNVFPSLHTSLSVTVAGLAVATKDAYPRWSVLATALASAVVFSTVYLGIHWVTDVVVGFVLGVGSIYLGSAVVERRERPERR